MHLERMDCHLRHCQWLNGIGGNWWCGNLGHRTTGGPMLAWLFVKLLC